MKISIKGTIEVTEHDLELIAKRMEYNGVKIDKLWLIKREKKCLKH